MNPQLFSFLKRIAQRSVPALYPTETFDLPTYGYRTAATCLFVLLLTLCPAKVASAQQSGESGHAPAAPVVVSEVLEQEVVDRVSLVGTAEPSVETLVAAEEAGLVQKVSMEEGDRVQEGDTLCVQETSQLRLTIEKSEATLAEAAVRLAQAQREWERQKRLFESDSVSERAYDNARFEKEAALKRVAGLKADIRLLRDQMAKTVIRAPGPGYVIERHVEVGEWLGKGAPVVTLALLDPIRVEVPVPERFIPRMRTGDKVQVRFDALPEQRFEGPIKAVIPKGDETAHTFPVRIELPNPKGVIKAGKLARIRLPVGDPYRAVLVPKDALVLGETGTVVFVVKEGVARMIPVETGTAHGSLVEVKGRLGSGDQVVVRGNERLRPEQAVTITASESPGPGERGKSPTAAHETR